MFIITQYAEIKWTTEAPHLQLHHQTLLINLLSSYHEKLFGWPGVKRPVSDLGLFGQILGALDGRHHPLHGEKRSQVGRVWGDDD